MILLYEESFNFVLTRKIQLLFPKVQKPVDPEWEMPFHFRQLACFNNYDIAHSAKV